MRALSEVVQVKALAFLAGCVVGALVSVGLFMAADLVEVGWPDE